MCSAARNNSFCSLDTCSGSFLLGDFAAPQQPSCTKVHAKYVAAGLMNVHLLIMNLVPLQ
jgi:hypothetical protein